MAKNNKLIQFLLKRNKEQSKEFCSPDATLWRRQYRQRHPTEIAALKCMDGRLNLSVFSQTPPGIIQPFRNIGGKFDFGWPYFGELMGDWVNYAIGEGRDCLLLVTYHFSKSDKHRGCRGFEYDIDASKAYTNGLVQQAELVFGSSHRVVYPIQVGIETDEETLIFHNNGVSLNLAEEVLTEDQLRIRLQQLYTDMKPEMVEDLLPLLLGNQRHVAGIRKMHRPLSEVEHKEQILVIGRGVDWLHIPNLALIIGPYSFNLGSPVATAGKILLDNLQSGRINKEDGVVLMASAACRDTAGLQMSLAKEKANSMINFAHATITEHVPDLLPYLQMLAGVTDLNTREYIPITIH